MSVPAERKSNPPLIICSSLLQRPLVLLTTRGFLPGQKGDKEGRQRRRVSGTHAINLGGAVQAGWRRRKSCSGEMETSAAQEIRDVPFGHLSGTRDCATDSHFLSPPPPAASASWAPRVARAKWIPRFVSSYRDRIDASAHITSCSLHPLSPATMTPLSDVWKCKSGVCMQNRSKISGQWGGSSPV